MRREKITIERKAPAPPPPTTISEDNVTDINLQISIELEFEGVKTFGFKDVLNDLTKVQHLKRVKEISKFKTYINKVKSSSHTKKTRIELFRKFLKDLNIVAPSLAFDTDKAIKSLFDYYLARKNKGFISKKTFNNSRKTLRIIWRDCFQISDSVIVQYFPSPSKRTGSLHGATIVSSVTEEGVKAKAYSVNDLKLLQRLLVFYARKLSSLHKLKIKSEEVLSTSIVFNYERGEHCLSFESCLSAKIIGGISNLLGNKATVFYMMLFVSITGANLSPVMRLKRKNLVINPGERDICTIELSDRRKGKVEVSPHLIKKHQSKLVDEFLNHSTQIDDSDDAFLFPMKVGNGVFSSFSSSAVNSQLQIFKKRTIEGEYGEKLHISAKKLRDSHGQLFSDLNERAEVLGNSKSVSAKHYSEGNPEDNTDKLQQGMNAYTLSLLSGEKLFEISERFNPDIDIKLIDSDEGKAILKQRYASKTMAGGICRNGVTSPEANLFKRTLNKLSLVKDGEVRCNNILACFTCINHVFVNVEEDLYVLMSLQMYLEESIYGNEAGGLFGNKVQVNKAINEIEWMKDNRYSSKMVNKIRNRIKYSGVHPIWLFDWEG